MFPGRAGKQISARAIQLRIKQLAPPARRVQAYPPALVATLLLLAMCWSHRDLARRARINGACRYFHHPDLYPSDFQHLAKVYDAAHPRRLALMRPGRPRMPPNGRLDCKTCQLSISSAQGRSAHPTLGGAHRRQRRDSAPRPVPPNCVGDAVAASKGATGAGAPLGFGSPAPKTLAVSGAAVAGQPKLVAHAQAQREHSGQIQPAPLQCVARRHIGPHLAQAATL